MRGEMEVGKEKKKRENDGRCVMKVPVLDVFRQYAQLFIDFFLYGLCIFN